MKSLEQYQPLCASIFDGAFGGIASGASSLIGSTVGGILQNNAIKKQNEMIREENALNRKFANEEATNSYLRQKHLMKMQMDYDSAVNQRKRLEEAGLNPNMMMDGGNAGSVSSQSAPQANQPSSIPYQAQRYEWLQNLSKNAAEIALLQAQAAKEKAQANNLNSGSDLNKSYIDSLWESTRGQRIRNDVDEKYYELGVKIGLDRQDAERAIIESRRINENIQTALSQRQFSVMTPLIAANTYMDTILKEFQASNIDVNTKQGRVILSNLATKYAIDFALAKAQTRFYGSIADLNEQEFNFNNATFNARRDILNYKANIAKFDLRSSSRLDFKQRLEFKSLLHNANAFLDQLDYQFQHAAGVTFQNMDSRMIRLSVEESLAFLLSGGAYTPTFTEQPDFNFK